MNDPASWQQLPILRALFLRWRDSRAKALDPARFRQPFRRDWEVLLEEAGIRGAEARREADRDARMLAKAGLLELKFVRFREYQIQRVGIPLEAEDRLRVIFAAELPLLPTRETFDPSQVDWHPALSFLRNVRTGLASEDLLAIQEFLVKGGLDRPLVPIKERSLEIFGDEKRLDAMRNTAFFLPDRLPFETLRCYQVAEPLGWARGHGTGTVLVIENASTWESFRYWNRRHQRYSAIIYGCGNRFADSIRSMADVFEEIGGVRPIQYFGDLDPQGIRIPMQASNHQRLYGGPEVAPALEWYEALLTVSAGRGTPLGDADPLDPLDYEWLGPLADAVREVFERGLRIPQEYIGRDFLGI